jgi:hypothetical protein
MIIKKFLDFVNEAYLKGGRQPIYHFTYRLYEIIKSDELRASKPARASHGYDKSISLTRNIYYTGSYNICIELNYDELLKHGYRSYPIDEWAWEKGKINTWAIKNRNFGKANFPAVKAGKRGTKHNLDLPKEPALETEFEERIYKNIENLGKFILKIFINSKIGKPEYATLKDYLEKYPHIEIFQIGKDIRFDVKNITNDILKNKVTTI